MQLVLEVAGSFLIRGRNSKLEIGFYYDDFRFIEFVIEDLELSEMSILGIVDGVTDDRYSFRLETPGEKGSHIQELSGIHPSIFSSSALIASNIP